MSTNSFPELGTLDELEAYALALQAAGVLGPGTGGATNLLNRMGLLSSLQPGMSYNISIRGRLWGWMDKVLDPDGRSGVSSTTLAALRRDAERAFEEWRELCAQQTSRP